MIDTQELHACLVRKGLRKVDGAIITGVSAKTFYTWLSKGVMPTDKAELLIKALDIQNPQEIFFSPKSPVT